MLIRIKTKDLRLRLYLPTALLFSGPGFSAACYFLRDYVSVPPLEKEALAKQWRDCRRQCRGLALVDVRTGEGEEIAVIL